MVLTVKTNFYLTYSRIRTKRQYKLLLCFPCTCSCEIISLYQYGSISWNIDLIKAFVKPTRKLEGTQRHSLWSKAFWIQGIQIGPGFGFLGKLFYWVRVLNSFQNLNINWPTFKLSYKISNISFYFNNFYLVLLREKKD